jgi:hypothetical protein
MSKVEIKKKLITKKDSKEKITIKIIRIIWRKKIEDGYFFTEGLNLKRKINFTKELKKKPPREWGPNFI